MAYTRGWMYIGLTYKAKTINPTTSLLINSLRLFAAAFASGFGATFNVPNLN